VIRRRWLLVGLICAAQCLMSSANAADNVTAPPEAVDKPAQKWQYEPRQIGLWKKAMKLMEQPKTTLDVLDLVPTEAPRASLQKGYEREVELLGGMALAKANLVLAAQFTFFDLLAQDPGADQAQAALQELAKLALEKEIDEGALENFAFHYTSAVRSDEAQGMLNFEKWRSLNRHGFSDWADVVRAEVEKSEVWKEDLAYYRGVVAVAKEDIDSAVETFREVGTNPKTRSRTQHLANLQLARLLFERREFNQAFQIYQKLDLPLRERGRALLEMAWSQYYEKNYSEALGILHALRNPVFDSSQSPERIVLQMLILRDLCHFEEVKVLEQQFHTDYDSVYSDIEARRPVDKNDRIASLTLLDLRLQKMANLVYGFRKERDRLKSQKFANKKLAETLVNKLNEREVDLRFLLENEIKMKSQDVASFLIDEREQVKFVGYSSTIQSNSDNTGKSDYAGVQIPKFAYEQLYWPVRFHEFWWDEVSYYRANIESRCPAKKAPQQEHQ
jgi:hypothetical protein